MRDEVERYGHYSLAAESMYDHPFQWGSKRTGPDLARVGGKYSDAWHRDHLRDPRSVVPGSVMPDYSWLDATDLDFAHIKENMNAQAIVGVPYTAEKIANAEADVVRRRRRSADAAIWQALSKADVRDFDGNPARITEADALIAYLQMLGTQSTSSSTTTRPTSGEHDDPNYKAVSEFAQAGGSRISRDVRAGAGLRVVAVAQEAVR